MSDLVTSLLDDLSAEGDLLRAAVADLDGAGWATPTPAPGWTVATQIAHLLWTDEVAVVAARSHESDGAKQDWDEIVLAAIDDPLGYVDHGALELAQLLAPGELLERWSAGRRALRDVLLACPSGQRMPWFGPPMSPASMATARYMETWAHALDVYAALTVTPEITDRIKPVAHLGVRTRDYAFAAHDEAAPTDEFRVELSAPSGEVWTWGPDDAAQSVTGPAYAFCLLVTQRIHRADTRLVAVGDDADHWLDIAQAFAGPPGEGRAARAGG